MSSSGIEPDQNRATAASDAGGGGGATMDDDNDNVDPSEKTSAGGWAVWLTALAGTVVSYELAIQRQLTAPPLVYGQLHDETAPIGSVYKAMNSQQNSIVTRPIQPSLFVGTRATLLSDLPKVSRERLTQR